MRVGGVFCLAVVVGGSIAPCLGQRPLGPPTLENLLGDTERPPARPPARPPLEAPHAPPQPVPAAADVDEARELVKQAYEDDYRRIGKNPEPLIHKLLDAAGATDVAARRYALLLEAEEVATLGGDHGRAFDLMDIRAQAFQIDGLQERLDRLSAALTPDTRKNPDLLTRLFAEAMRTAERALEQDALEPAKAAAELASSIAKSLFLVGKAQRNNVLVDDGDHKGEAARLLRDVVKARVDRFARYQKAVEALAVDADDPTANEDTGRYLCFQKGRWAEGLPKLVKSAPGDLRDAAREELEVRQAEPPDTARAFALAGRWWTLSEAEGLDAEDAAAMRRHAGAIYGSVGDKLTEALDKQLAKTRFAKSGATAADVRAITPDNGGRENTAGRVGPEGPVVDPQPLGLGDDRVGPAIERGLAWLVAHQLADGGWSLDHSQSDACRGRCSHAIRGRPAKDRTAATALALLCFTRSGQSHKKGPHQQAVRRGVMFLAGTVNNVGQCYGEGGSMYSQGCAALALAELYESTRDVRIKAAAQASLNFIQEAQDPRGGGWRYQPRQAGDTSATGWQMAALHAGKSAGLMVRPAVFTNAARFLDSVQADAGATYGYVDGSSPTAARSAVGLLCRIRLGWAAEHPALRDGANRLAAMQPSADLYFDYYATMVLRHVRGEAWPAWKTNMIEFLVRQQSANAHETGSWHDGVSAGHAAQVGGRLYCTTLATMTLCA